jgi:hypothetical protein
MIKNDTELRQTFEQLERMQRALTTLREKTEKEPSLKSNNESVSRVSHSCREITPNTPPATATEPPHQQPRQNPPTQKPPRKTAAKNSPSQNPHLKTPCQKAPSTKPLAQNPWHTLTLVSKY